MKNTKLNKNWIFLGVGILIGILVLGFLFSRINNTAELASKNSNKVTIEDREKGSTITFHRDGLVEYKDKTSDYSTVWSSEKMSAFFEYLLDGEFSLGGSYWIILPDGTVVNAGQNDELIDEVVDEITGDDDPDPGPIGGVFNTPAPGGGGSGGGNPTPGSGGGGSGIPSWCKHWRLSFCADGWYDDDDPTPTPISNEGVIQAKDCAEWKAQSTNKTVISGDQCAQYFPTPTPPDN